MENSSYFDSEELVTRWQIKPFDLLALIKSGKITWFMEEDFFTSDPFLKLKRKTERKILTESFLIGNLHFLFFKKDEIYNFEKTNPEYQPQATPLNAKTQNHDIFPIETPPGTTWNKLFLTVRNYEITEIRHPGGTVNKRHTEMGLTERGAGKTGTVAMLYFMLAWNGGESNPIATTKDIKPTMHRLRKQLRALFPGIDGEPLPYIKGQWEAAFNLKADRDTLLETLPDATREILEHQL